MTADAGQAVAERLRRLAEGAHRVDDGPTAARAVALDRHRRRRGTGWAAGVLAVVLLVSGASFARTAVTAAPPAATPIPAPVTSTYVAPTPGLVEAPVRGSLADDEEFLTAMAGADWTDPTAPDGQLVDWGGPSPDPGTQRVVYAADVPGGHRWAVVVARAGTEWVWTWFTGPRGAEPAEMTPVIGGVPLWADPLALMDGSAETSTLVVLGEPGLEAEYSPSLDRTSGGELVRDFDPLPLVDGVPLGVVITPVTWNAGEVQVTSPVGQQSLSPMLSGPLPSWPAFPTGPVDEALVAPCLEQLGLDVQTRPGLSWEESEQLSSAEEAAREHEIAACFRAAEP
ncbi:MULTISPECIES: hypothetical protein [unclassified Modestobacter]|uniref:hypothetical protein n=1 Tax=unclassified Modestobacter TaxID=2643866 RepID=UPI0022AA47A3|nr:MULTISPECIES: hypothetical protein [unclassified Modestobacter]MCZ2826478.1 hypothetical protein [Modestobacter sp. VKM Ac-2981]MCZ2852457.1 hypothetical protein [Modestobacter sp. VKM Ac-2982]